jgi:hypothetical protein
MSRASFGFKATSGLVLAATLLALAGLSSRANAAEPQASNLAMALTCPEQQGQLKRLSASSDGASCTYGIDSDKTFRVDLQRVEMDKKSPIDYNQVFLMLLFGIETKKVLEELIKYGVKFNKEYMKFYPNGNIGDYYARMKYKPNKLGLIYSSVAIQGAKSGPLVIGIITSKNQVNDDASQDFVDLLKNSSDSWFKPVQPAPSH